VTKAQDQLKLIVGNAVQALYAENFEIIRLDVAERTICAQLAGILQRSFDHHSVHTEYNRHGVESKEIDLPNTEGILTSSRVNPDIVIHQPGHDRENVLVIGVKKTTNAVSDDADLVKLAEIKRQIGYSSALFLRLPTGPNADAAETREIWLD
jgi:hypothetical protein